MCLAWCMLGHIPSKSVVEITLRAARAACKHQHGVSLQREYCGWDESLTRNLRVSAISITLATFSPEHTTWETICARLYFRGPPSPGSCFKNCGILRSLCKTGFICMVWSIYMTESAFILRAPSLEGAWGASPGPNAIPGPVKYRAPGGDLAPPPKE